MEHISCWSMLICDSLLRDDINTIKKRTENLIQINADKYNHIILSCHQNAGQDHDIKIPNRFFENMAQFKYL
jgi:hypothetical protein